MLESENLLTRSIGDLTLNAIRATGAEKRNREKLEKIENEQKEKLNSLIQALSNHVIKYKICDKHLKRYILENKHRFLGTVEFFNQNEFNFIKQFNEFSRILKIYKGLCQYLNPKKLQSFVDLIFDGKLNSKDFIKYKNNFLSPKRNPICNLSLEDSSEESSEICSTVTAPTSDSGSYQLESESYQRETESELDTESSQSEMYSDFYKDPIWNN